MLKTVEFLTPLLWANLGAEAAFTDVTLVDIDRLPPAAHSIILKMVKPLFKFFLNLSSHPQPLIHPEGT